MIASVERIRRVVPHTHVYHNAAQSINDSTWTALAMNSEREDTDGSHDTVTNNSRLTAQSAGRRIITGAMEFAFDADGVRYLAIRLNGATFLGMMSVYVAPTTAAMAVVSYRLAANDYVELCAFQSSGGALNVQASANYSPEFSMTWTGL